MDKRAIIEVLRRHVPELKAAGVIHLRLFGSVARGEQTVSSDVDLMAEFDPAQRRTLLNMVRVENFLSDLLGARVDLSIANALREPVKSRAVQEAILAF
jgi:hypothetical protein